jgi:hypothetical protein
MAKVSETLSHPDFGELGWLPEDSHWYTAIRKPTGDWLDVIVDPGDNDRYVFLESAAKLFRWALDNEPRILRDALQAELLELYNDTWRRSDGPVLTAEDLAGRLKWTLLDIGSLDIVPVTFWYGAGELFGNHNVAIEVNADLTFRDIDLRG